MKKPQSGRRVGSFARGNPRATNAEAMAMAKAQKVETNNEYLDAQPEDFSAAVQSALAEERQIYDMLKAQKAKVLALVQAEMPVAEGREVKHTAYTRWGQWQIVIGDKAQPKQAAGARKTLADYLAAQQGNGHAA